MSVVLAPDNNGMRVDYEGLLGVKRLTKLDRYLLRNMIQHLSELGKRWYAGDQTVVDEFLQLYCIEEEAREAVKQAKANQISGD